jgi:hypothetical protein
LRNHVLVHLESTDLLSELLSLVRITHRRLAGGPGQSDGPGGATKAGVIEMTHADFKAFAFLADETVWRNPKIIKGQLSRGRGMDAQLVKLAAAHAGLIQVDVECRHAAMFLGAVGVGKDDARIRYRRIGYPDLRPIDEITRAVSRRGGFNRRDVRPGIRLGDGEQAYGRTAQQSWKVFLLLFFVAELEKRHGGTGLHIEVNPDRAVNAGNLFGDQRVGEKA